MSADKVNYPAVKALLVIDDDEQFMNLLKNFCARIFSGAEVEYFNPVVSGRPAGDFNWSRFDLLFLDYDLDKGENGLDWLRHYKNATPVFPATIMLTAHGNEEIAVEAMRAGALDYINKEKLSLVRLHEAIRNVMKKREEETLQAGSLMLQTTLYNKVHFYKKLKEAIDDYRHGSHAFLLQIRINEHPGVYASHGILVADNFIAHMAQEIGTLLKNETCGVNITRIGDALLACLMTGHAHAQGGEQVARLICDGINDKAFTVTGNRIVTSVSIGIAPITASDRTPEEVLHKADQACRNSARQEGNSWQWYMHAAEGQAPAVTEVKQAVTGTAPAAKEEAPVKPGRPAKSCKHVIDMPEAIKQNLIQASFYPFVGLSDSASQFEADLFQLRMQVIDVKGKEVAQSDLASAEFKSGNPGMLDLWAVRFALSQLLALEKIKGLRKRGLFIRLFEESLVDNKLYDWTKNLLAKIKMPSIASSIVFEISPPAFLQNKENAMNFIAQARDTWGMGFALHDVVSEKVYDTVQKQAGFEFLVVSVRQNDRRLIDSLTENARAAGALTILEHISNAQELNLAIQHGFDYGQGEFIQPPQDKLDNASEVIQI